MSKGTVEYGVAIAGLRFDAITVTCPHSKVEKFVLVTEDDKSLKITVHLINVFTFDEAGAIIRDVLPPLLDKLAFHHNVAIDEPHLTSGSLPKDESGSFYTVQKGLMVTWSVAASSHTLDDGEREELAQELGQPPSHPALYALYRFTRNQGDHVARFMFLYNILLQLNDDLQPQVDKFIREQVPGVPQTPSPRKSGRYETLYTRLRNEVGHGRSGVDPAQTHLEIEENVEEFEELVRKAILLAA